jgi:hypothetical protein
LWLIVRYYPSTGWRHRQKAKDAASQDGWYSERDSNLEPAESNTKALTLELIKQTGIRDSVEEARRVRGTFRGNKAYTGRGPTNSL